MAGFRASRGSPRSSASARLSPPRTTASSRGLAEDGDGRVRRRVERLIRLLFPAAGEALLRPAARRAAAVHQARPGLGVGERRRVAGEHPGGVPAEADQQDADGAGYPRVRGDRRGDLVRVSDPGRQRKRFRERRMALGHRAVRRREGDGPVGRRDLKSARRLPAVPVVCGSPCRRANAEIQPGYRSAETSTHLAPLPATLLTTHCLIVFTDRANEPLTP